MSYHTIIIVGRLGRDPELRYTPAGQAVTNLSMASDETTTDKDGNRKVKTTWWRVTVWGKQAENANQFLSKGRQVLVEARMNPDENGNPRIWERNDGTPAASYEVTASTVRFLGGKKDSGTQVSQSTDFDDFNDF